MNPEPVVIHAHVQPGSDVDQFIKDAISRRDQEKVIQGLEASLNAAGNGEQR